MRRNTFRSWSRVYLRLPLHRAHQQLQHHYCRKVQVQYLFQHPFIMREQMSKNGQTQFQTQSKIQNPKKNEDHEPERVTPFSSEIPEWLQEFREHLVDESVPEPHAARFPVVSDSHASSSHEPSLVPLSRVVTGNHSIFTHSQKDRNCEIFQRTKITKALCRRRIGGVVLCAEHFSDLITTDHKILSDGSESRKKHRYAILVQDLATQLIQSYPCNTKTSLESGRSLQKFLELVRKSNFICTDNSMEFGEAGEDLTWNHCTSSPHLSETNGIAERAVSRIMKGHLRYFSNRDWTKIGRRIPWNAIATCE